MRGRGPRPHVAAAAACAVAVALLAGCSSTRPADPSASPSAEPAIACALAPATELAAVTGGRPGAGTGEEGPFGDGGCAWHAGSTVAVLGVTDSPDADLLASAYPQPVRAAAVPGADRGWASADRHRIVVVKGDRGVLLTVTGTVRGSQAAYDALAAAILERL